MKKNRKLADYILLIVIISAILFLSFYFYWPLFYDRHIASPGSILLPDTNTVAVREEEKIAPESFKRMLIPVLGIDAVLIFPEEDFTGNRNDFVEANLDDGVVYFPNGVQDLLKENISFFGHSSSLRPQAEYARVFINLDRLETGDEIILLDENEEQIKYKVVIEPTTVDSNESSIVRTDKGEGLITLVTCWPPGTIQKRLYVTGEIEKK